MKYQHSIVRGLTKTIACLIGIASIADANECQILCDPIIDYQHSSTALQFSRTQYSPVINSNPADLIADNNESRHRFEIVLTQSGSTRSIFDHLGQRHDFTANDDGTFTSSTATGYLNVNNGQYQWTDDTNNVHIFQGSYLTQFIQADGQALTLQYQHQRLNAVSDDVGNTLTLNYRDDVLHSLTTPEGSYIDTSQHACLYDTPPENTTCDTHANPVDGYPATTAQPGVSRIDARPASCESYFIEYFGTERGSQIEDGLAGLSPYQGLQQTVRSYPIVDFIDNDRLIAVRSRDLANNSFNDPGNPNALLYRLMRDGREIQDRFLDPLAENGEVSVEELGLSTTIQEGVLPPNMVLQLVIRDQIASPSHWTQIAQARERLWETYSITLEVVIIP